MQDHPCAHRRGLSVRRASGGPLGAWGPSRRPSSCKPHARLYRLAEPHLKHPSGPRPTDPRLWTHELAYKAANWYEARPIMQVVKERCDDLLFDRVFLVRSISRVQMNWLALPEHYRQRGKPESHMSELMDVLAPTLSSTNRPKTHLRGKKPKTVTPAVDAFACNEVRLLIAMLAYQTMHMARRAMARATRSPWKPAPLARRRAPQRRASRHLGPPHDPDPRRSRGAILGGPLAADPDPARRQSMSPRLAPIPSDRRQRLRAP
jgi:hypothetical protein